MSTSTNSTDSKIPSPTGYTESKIPAPPAPVVEEKSIIEDMYADPTPPAPKAPVEPPKEETPPPESKPSTGYGKEETPPVEPPKEETPPANADEEKLKEHLKELPESINKEKVLKFATDNKMTPEQLKAYTDFVKEDHKNAELANQEFVKAERTKWKTELTTDPEFGGENFDKNVDRVEKVLEKYMPNMKKMLTERGSMLPPYIMRDFLALSKILNPVSPLVTGDPGKAEDKGKNFLEDMYQ